MRKILQFILKRPVIRDTLSTTFWNTFGKGLGFLIPFFIAALYGIGVKTDIFFFIYGVILYFADIFANSIQSNAVPFISKMKSDSSEKINLFINRLFSLSLLVLSGVAVIFAIIGWPIIRIITHFPQGSYDLLFRLFLETMPLFILIILSSILAGVLNAHFKFWLPAFSPGIRAVVCIATIFLLRQRLDIHAVALGYLLGEIVKLLIFIIVLQKNRIISLRLDFHFEPELISFFKVVSFQMASIVAIGLNPIVDKTMASWLNVGSVSILQYADRLYMIPVSFISSGLIVVILSHWSESYYKHKKIELLRNDMHKVMGLVTLISLALTLLLWIFSKPLVSLVYARGSFPLESLEEVRVTFLCLQAGVVFYLVGQIYVRAHLVLKNTKIFVYSALIANVFNIVLNYIFMQFWGVRGIALSTTFSYAAVLVYLWWSFDMITKREKAKNVA